MNHSTGNFFRNKYSRAKKLLDIARNESNQNYVPTNQYNNNSDDSFNENSGRPESPLPTGADLLEIETLSNLLSDDFNEKSLLFTSTDYAQDFSSIAQQDQENKEIPELDNADDHSSCLLENIEVSSLTVRNDTVNSSTRNYVEIVSQNESIRSPSSPGTPHPSSPECHINHLDIDCMNDFCPYFIGNPIREPLSQLSIFSGYSTPQANTPLSYDFEDASTPTSITKRVRRDKGNVRRKHEQEWKDTKRKTLLNRGKKYVTRKGILKPKKTIKSLCKCQMKCFDKISNSQRHRLLKDFWGLGDHHRQWSYVSNLVTRNPKRRIFTDKPDSRRKYTIKYRLPVPNVDENQSVTHVNVCKTQFLATFSISEQFVYTAIEKPDKATGIIECDGRGKHDKHPRKITDVIKQSVCDHIKCLQPVEAHYVRKDSARLYLDSGLNFHKLFSLYNEWIDPEIYNDKAKTKRQYKTVVNDNFKLSFFKPKKDRCDMCHIYTNIQTPTNDERQKYDEYISNKNLARDLKKKDKQEATSSNGKILTATFDFQKVLNSPCGEVSIFYYKRKLGSMNFTVFDVAKKNATCFMWHEAEGKRGANEVSSCLFDFVSKAVNLGTQEFRFWSDNCAGQNRNRIVFAAYMILAQKYKVTIKHTFLEKGHTQQEGDSVHALIERRAKNKIIYTPFEWFALVRWVKNDENPYNVIEMDHTKFYDFKSTILGKNWSKNLSGNNVQWRKIRELKVLPDNPYQIHYKYNLSVSEYMTISTTSNTRRRRQVDTLILGPIYNNPIPIPKAKRDDLISLCDSGIIPSFHHEFYRNLTFVDSTRALPTSDTESE